MKRIANQYFQYDQRFITTTLSFKSLSEISEVLKYGESKYGYQRGVNELHLNKMVSTLKNTKDILSPTSIILGVNSENIEKCIKGINIGSDIDFYDDREQIVVLNLDEIDFKFRIVDGQHRIAAFNKYLSDTSIEIDNRENLEQKYLFNVVIIVLEEKDRIKEVELFRSINSKAKPLKTDLAMLAMYNYETIFRIESINIEEHLKARTIFKLNEESEFSGTNYWINGIKVDINNRQALGSIGFKAFGESIHSIVKQYVEKQNLEVDSKDQDFDNINLMLNNFSEDITQNLILPAWKIVNEKWPETFLEMNNIQNEEKEKTFYNKDYYIQQTMGVKSLHGILTDLYKESRDEKETIERFNELITNSSLKHNDWKKKEKMRGLSSEAGFKIIREMIKK